MVDDSADAEFDEPSDLPDEPEGYVTIRESLYGLVLLWIAALVAVTTIQIIVFSLFRPAMLVFVLVVGATVTVVVGYRSLQVFGLIRTV